MATAFARAGTGTSGSAAPRAELFAVAVGLALVVGIANRLIAGWHTPIWYDETYTAVIATQPDLASLIEWCLSELSGPVYYGLIWAWEKAAGDSNVALRIPSFVFSVAAPLVILWKGHPDRTTRLIWAGLVAVWSPGFAAATEARPHALLFLLATAQAIAFLALLRRPDLPRAFAWTALAALTVLTHYHAAVIAGLQGSAFLLWRGRAALRCWPALIVLAPMLAWMSQHLPVVLDFATSDSKWQAVWPLESVLYLPQLLLGASWLPSVLVVAMIVSLPVLAARTNWRFSTRDGDLALVLSGLIAVALVFSLALVSASFTPRYLLSYMPAVLFGLALWLRAAMRLIPFAPTVVIAMMTGLALGPLYHRIVRPHEDVRYVFNFELASDWMRSHGKVERLVFLWDNPTRNSTGSSNLAEVSSWFLRRSGEHPQVEVMRPPARRDPRPALLAAAGNASGTAILWAADRTVPGTLIADYPLGLDRIDRRWRCRDHGDGETVAIYACVRR